MLGRFGNEEVEGGELAEATSSIEALRRKSFSFCANKLDYSITCLCQSKRRYRVTSSGQERQADRERERVRERVRGWEGERERTSERVGGREGLESDVDDGNFVKRPREQVLRAPRDCRACRFNF